MPSKKIDFSQVTTGTALFLAEGKSEAGFLEKVLQGAGVPSHVFTVEGETKLPLVLKTLVGDGVPERVSCLGLMFDANADYTSRMVAIGDILRSAGLSFDRTRLTADGIYTGADLPIGIFLSPGNNRPGRIENLILEEIRESALQSCLMPYIECASALGHNLDEKGIVQTYISAHNGSVCGVGIAFSRGILDAQHSAYASARSMVAQLIASRMQR